ncbi:tRNA pseudouridine synthase 1 [Rhizophlyctis rosea]|nr:tRNA pseudouridine synthase 1 [Rhizophlyctis rosea]
MVDAKPEEEKPQGRRLAILYAYNGSEFQGLERQKGLKTVEGTLLSAVASVASGADASRKVSLINISRASTTEEGEHASRQVLSLEIVGESAVIPSAQSLNEIVPSGITVFDVVELSQNFSARRTCDARTYEFLIPTYVLAPPPHESHYRYPEQLDEEEEDIYPPDNLEGGPAGGLFTTLKRGTSIKKSLSRNKSMSRARSLSRSASSAPAHALMTEAPPPMPTDSVPKPQPIVAAPTPVVEPISPPASPPQFQKKKNPIMNFFSTLTRGGNKKSAEPARPQPLARAASYAQNDEAPYTAQNIPRPAPIPQEPSYASTSHVSFSTSAPAGADDQGIISTLKRSISRRSTAARRANSGFASEADPLASQASPDEGDDSNGPQYFDPLKLPEPTEEELSILRRYRITDTQFKALNHIIGIYNGTHNWHNYIPGAKYEDPRCYMRILNIELSKPEEHAGMEWVRVKVQAKAFARLQVRKMISLAVLVVRTNTPRSVVANSFGFAKVDAPECPAPFLILDQPHYDSYNSDCARRSAPTQQIDFEKHYAAIQSFRHSKIHDAIYLAESHNMNFEKWLRSVDEYSFLYTYYLNQRGVIRPRNAYVRPVQEGVKEVEVVGEKEYGSLGRPQQGVKTGVVGSVEAPGRFDPEPAAI